MLGQSMVTWVKGLISYIDLPHRCSILAGGNVNSCMYLHCWGAALEGIICTLEGRGYNSPCAVLLLLLGIMSVHGILSYLLFTV